MKTNQPQKNIQTDWSQIPVGDIFTFIKSYAFSRDKLINGVISKNQIGNIHYGDIHSTYTSPNIDVSKIEIPIVKDNFNPQNDTLLKDGDLVMSDASEDYEGVGVTVSIHGIGNKKIVGGLHTFVLRDEKGLTNEYYRQYIFRNPVTRNTMQKVANGVSVYGISKTAVSKIKLSLPPLSEQGRIVAVLETWDKAIEKLSNKIEVKKQIKKSLMQNLLTGKKRLNGFSDNWKTVKLGKFTKEINEYTQQHNEIDILTSSRSGLLLQSDYFKKQVTSEDNAGYKIIRKGEFTYRAMSDSDIFSFNRLKIIDVGAVSPAYSVFKIDGANPDFIDFLIKTPWFIHQAYKYSQGGTRLSLKLENLNEIEIRVPENNEQEAIAEILTIADQEIINLEKKLQIIEDQKKYLLNNLITGIIRTPETLSTKLTK